VEQGEPGCGIRKNWRQKNHTAGYLDEIEESLDTDFIQLDNGCFLGDRIYGRGNLLALELNSYRLYVQENIDGSYLY
jgi:hypothetical protein